MTKLKCINLLTDLQFENFKRTYYHLSWNLPVSHTNVHEFLKKKPMPNTVCWHKQVWSKGENHEIFEMCRNRCIHFVSSQTIFKWIIVLKHIVKQTCYLFWYSDTKKQLRTVLTVMTFPGVNKMPRETNQ